MKTHNEIGAIFNFEGIHTQIPHNTGNTQKEETTQKTRKVKKK